MGHRLHGHIPGGGAYTTFKVGDDVTGGTIPPPVEGLPPHLRVWFGISDVDEAAAKVAASNGTVVLPPMDTRIGRIAAFQDPAEAGFNVHSATQAG